MPRGHRETARSIRDGSDRELKATAKIIYYLKIMLPNSF